MVGAGVIGSACAAELARRGRRVVLCDPAPASGASRVAAGMLAPISEATPGEEATFALGVESLRRWPAFAAELEAEGAPIGLRDAGTLIVARDRDDTAAIDRLGERHAAWGLEITRLSSRDARALEPGLAPRTRGGLRVDADLSVDNRALLDALHTVLIARGVEIRTERITAVMAKDDVVRGVTTDRSTITADAVVVAAGWASGAIDGVVDGGLGLRPVKGQLLITASPTGTAPVSRTIRGLDVYCVPRGDGRLVVGATVEERGADTTVTAGAVHELLREAIALVPDVAEMTLLETTAGLRPAAADNAPLLGTLGPHGLVVATGHWRNGVLLAPLTAQVVADLVTSGRTDIDLSAVDPTRPSAGTHTPGRTAHRQPAGAR